MWTIWSTHKSSLVLALLALCAGSCLVPRTACAEDGGARPIAVNGQRSAVQCPALADGGAAACYLFPGPAKAAALALHDWPQLDAWRTAAAASAVAADAARKEAVEARGAAAAAVREAEKRKREADEQRQRAEKLQAVADGSFWSKLLGALKYVALPVGGFGLGYLVRGIVR